MDFVNLDIKVSADSREQGSYLVTANTSGRKARIESEGFSYPVEDRLNAINQSLVALGAKPARIATDISEHAHRIRTFGDQLFRSLFNGKVLQLYKDQKKVAYDGKKPLRLRLTLVPPELVALPWELLYDEDSKDYLCLAQNPEIILIRSIENAQHHRLRSPRSAGDNPPLRILGMFSDTRNRQHLKGEKEKREIDDVLQEAIADNLVEKPVWTETGQHEELRKRKYDKERWDIFHFIGHGRFDQENQKGSLEFEDERGNARAFLAKQLSLALHPATQLVVLNACETAQGRPSDPFSSIAYSLTMSGIPAVVAMQFMILDEAARQFANAFYTRLAQGETIEGAVAQARRDIYSASDNVDRLDWAAPLLYVSSSNSLTLRLPDKAEIPTHSKKPSPTKEKDAVVYSQETEIGGAELPGERETPGTSTIDPPEAKMRKLDPPGLMEERELSPADLPEEKTNKRNPLSSTLSQLPPRGRTSWLTWRGLSRRAKSGRIGAAVLLTLVLLSGGAFAFPRFFPPPSPKTFCLATDFTAKSPKPGGDESEKFFTNGAELAIYRHQILSPTYHLQYKCADTYDNNRQGFGDPVVGYQNLQSAIADPQVLGLVGPGDSSIALKDLLLAAQNSFPIVSPNTTTTCLTQPGQCDMPVDLQGHPNPYVRICANDLQQGAFDAAPLATSLHVHSIYVVYDNDDPVYGRGLADSFQRQFINAGGVVLDPTNAQISSSTTDEQFAQLAQKIVMLNPAGVFYGGLEASGIARLKKQLVQLGFTGPLITGDGVALDQQYIQDAGATTVNTYATALEPVIPQTDPFYQLYQSVYGSGKPDAEVSQAAGGYDAAMILINAIQQVIQTNPSAFQKGIQTLRAAVLQAVQNTIGYQGLTGRITFRDGDNLAADTTQPVYTVRNGQWVAYTLPQQ